MKTGNDKLKNISKVMVFLGIWLDGKFDLSPILTITFAFLGVFAGLYNFIKSVIKSGK